ncbi:MAG: hypothetical protein CMP53_08995 [Flavobacteriales bacterium]|nr:hypothetical protein [Flavobacteriales bacterium]|tara:strand:- start:2116 stop:2436 length:321 start_codon:yes stop_codon:yes gene_type:complete
MTEEVKELQEQINQLDAAMDNIIYVVTQLTEKNATKDELSELEVKLEEKLDYDDFEDGLSKEGVLQQRDTMSLVIKQLMYILDILGDKIPTMNVHDYALLESYRKR